MTKSAKKTEQPPSTPAKKSKKVAAPPAPPVPAVIEEVQPVEEASVEKTLADDFSEFLSKMQVVSSQLATLKNEFRTLEKKCLRELKAAKKASSKKKHVRAVIVHQVVSLSQHL